MQNELLLLPICCHQTESFVVSADCSGSVVVAVETVTPSRNCKPGSKRIRSKRYNGSQIASFTSGSSASNAATLCTDASPVLTPVQGTARKHNKAKSV